MCRIIKSPITGEQIQSELWSNLNVDYGENKADSIYKHTLSDEYVNKYGDWSKNESVFETDSFGEPLYNNGFKQTIINLPKERTELKEKLIAFIEGMGFKYEQVNNILSPNGDNVTAVTDFMLQTVQMINGANERTLSEESGHVYVEMLKQKESPLYDAMMREIVNYPIYNEVLEQYKDVYKDDFQMKEEAIGKMIADTIISGRKEIPQRINNWWARVKKVIANLFDVNVEQMESYLEIAKNDILDGKVGKIERVNYKMFDITPATKSKIDKIKADDKLLIKKDVYKDGVSKERYFYNELETSRISDDIEKEYKKAYGSDYVDNQQIQYELQRSTGVFGHGDFENVITRYLEKRDNKPLTNKSENLPAKDYLKIEKYVHKLLSQFPPNSEILTEVKVYNKKKNKAGTIDLLVIEPNGKVHIFDWKFMDSVKDDVVSGLKKRVWNIQLDSYRDTLEQYGFKDFGKMRMIPISTVYENGAFKKIDLDGEDVFEKAQPARVEKTGVPELDNLLLKLFTEYEILNNERNVDAKRSAEKGVIMSSLTKAINEIQISQTLNQFIANANAQLNRYEKMFIEEDALSMEQIREINDYVNYYSGLIAMNLGQYDINEKGVQQNNIRNLAIRNQELKAVIAVELDVYIKNKELNLSELGINKYINRFTTLNNFKNPVFRLFNTLKNEKEDLIENETRDYNKRLADLIEHLKKEELSSKLFDKILAKNSKNEYTGNLINTYKSEFFTELKTAKLNWLRKNTKFKEGAKEEYEIRLNALIDAEKERSLNDEQAKKNIERFRYRNDFWSEKYSDKAYQNYQESGKQHRSLEPIDSWYSNEYIELKNNPNKAISKLYVMFQDTIKLANEHTADSIRRNFIPSLEKNLVKKILDFGGIGGMQNDIIDSMTRPPYETQEDIYGNPVYKIPLKYTNDLRGDKSLDLGTVFSLFHHSVLQNKYLGEIEAESNVLLEVLKRGKYYDRDWKGNFRIEENARVSIDPNNNDEFKETLTQLKGFINNSIYGVKNTTKSFEIFGIDGTKLIGGIQNYYSMLNLGLNPFSAFSNYAGGTAMLSSVAAKNKFFNSGDVAKAKGLIYTRNKTAMHAIEYFGVSTDNNTFAQAKRLSTDFVEKNLSLDKMYVLQSKGEWMVQNSTLLSFLNAHSINDNGETVRKNDNDKSLLELSEEVNGQFTIKGLTEIEFNKIRTKVRAINNEVMGSLGERDYMLYKNELSMRLLMQFKSWIPAMAKSRFGDLTYNANLETFEEGRFKRFASDIVNKQFFSNVKDLGMLIYSSKPNQSLLEKIEETYNNHIANNPEFEDKLSLEEYTEMYIQNVKSTYRDIANVIGFYALLLAAKPDDDEKDQASGIRKFLYNGLNKSLTELTFWFDTNSFIQLAGSSVPIIGALDRASDLIKEVGYEVLGDSDKAKPLDKLGRVVIGWNTYNKIVQNIEKIQ
jgi:ribosomal protein S17E